jgi:hypothetical protein
MPHVLAIAAAAAAAAAQHVLLLHSHVSQNCVAFGSRQLKALQRWPASRCTCSQQPLYFHSLQLAGLVAPGSAVLQPLPQKLHSLKDGPAAGTPPLAGCSVL